MLYFQAQLLSLSDPTYKVSDSEPFTYYARAWS